MSTIHDALKKAQEKISTGDERFSPPPAGSPRTSDFTAPAPNTPVGPTAAPVDSGKNPSPPAASPSSSPSKRKRSPLWVAIYITAFITVLFVLADILKLPQSFPLPKRLSFPSRPATFQPANGDLVLNGIMSMGTKKVALINNKIYETGEMVDDLRITEITADTVKLSKDGQEKILKVK